MKKKMAYRMAAAGKVARIDIYEDIVDSLTEDLFEVGLSARTFSRDLAALGDIQRIDLHVNSYGGSVFDGAAIYNGLKDHPAQVDAYVDGIAASAAADLTMAADNITMAENAFMMIHQASGMAYGKADELRSVAALLESIDAVQVDVISARSGADREQVTAWLNAETWFNAEEAVAAGLADRISPNKTVNASMDRMKLAQRFKNAPKGALEPARLGCELGPDGQCLPDLEEAAAPAKPCACRGATGAAPGVTFTAVDPDDDEPQGAEVPQEESEEPEDDLPQAAEGADDGGHAADEIEDDASADSADRHQARALSLRQERARRRSALAKTG